MLNEAPCHARKYLSYLKDSWLQHDLTASSDLPLFWKQLFDLLLWWLFLWILLVNPETLTFNQADKPDLALCVLDWILTLLLYNPLGSETIQTSFLSERLCFDLYSFPCLLIICPTLNKTYLLYLYEFETWNKTLVIIIFYFNPLDQRYTHQMI